MSREQQTPIGQQSDERFISMLKEVSQLKETYVGQQLYRYRKNATRTRLVFRYSGILIILLSVTLPLLTTLKYAWITIVLPIVSLIIVNFGIKLLISWQLSC
jgi:hypothetical protein